MLFYPFFKAVAIQGFLFYTLGRMPTRKIYNVLCGKFFFKFVILDKVLVISDEQQGDFSRPALGNGVCCKRAGYAHLPDPGFILYAKSF